jgi:hypothetical protein
MSCCCYLFPLKTANRLDASSLAHAAWAYAHLRLPHRALMYAARRAVLRLRDRDAGEEADAAAKAMAFARGDTRRHSGALMVTVAWAHAMLGDDGEGLHEEVMYRLAHMRVVCLEVRKAVPLSLSSCPWSL